MDRPFSVNIRRIKCYSTCDVFGSDKIYGLLGEYRFPIGEFTAGNDYNLDINQTVPLNEFYLRFFEQNAVMADREIGMIDLSAILGFQTLKNVQGNGGNYDVTLFVTPTTE